MQNMTKSPVFNKKKLALKTSRFFSFLPMVWIPIRGSFPGNLKSFGPYPKKVQGQNYQKRQIFIKKYVFLVPLSPQKQYIDFMSLVRINLVEKCSLGFSLKM